jgi:hypothetical protein
LLPVPHDANEVFGSLPEGVKHMLGVPLPDEIDQE